MTSNRGHSEGEPASHAPAQEAWTIAAACLLFALALALRCWGLEFGLPVFSNPYVRPDESLIVVAAVRMLEGAADPHLSVYPGFFIGLCAALFKAGHGAMQLFGTAAAPTVPLDFGLHPSPYFVLARGLSALCGALTVPVVWLLGHRLGGRATGLVAAGLLAVAPLAVRDAHFGVTDTPTAFLIAAALLALLASEDPPEPWLPRAWVVASVLLGCAIGCKYSALGVLPVLALACMLAPLPARSRATRLVLCLAITAVAFTVCNPYVLVRPLEYWAAVRGSAGFIYGASGHGESLRLALGQLLHPLRYGPGGYLGLLLAGVGAVYCLRRGSGARPRLLLLATLLALTPALSFRETIFFRYVILALPLLAVLAGLGVAWLGCPVTPRLRLPAWGLLLMLCVLPTTLLCVRLDRLLATPDTRTMAGEWLRREVTPKTPVVLFGRPESEPQITETRASLLRRRDYVVKCYGARAAATINQFYDLQLSARPASFKAGHELLRTPTVDALPKPPFVLIQAAYPATTPPPLPPALDALVRNGTLNVSPAFTAVGLTGRGPYDRDRLDAFFLPFTGLSQVQRPGPNLFVYRVTPTATGVRP